MNKPYPQCLRNSSASLPHKHCNPHPNIFIVSAVLSFGSWCVFSLQCWCVTFKDHFNNRVWTGDQTLMRDRTRHFPSCVRRSNLKACQKVACLYFCVVFAQYAAVTHLSACFIYFFIFVLKILSIFSCFMYKSFFFLSAPSWSSCVIPFFIPPLIACNSHPSLCASIWCSFTINSF